MDNIIYEDKPNKKGILLCYFLLTIPILAALTALNVVFAVIMIKYKVFSFAPVVSVIFVPLLFINLVPVYYLFFWGIKKIKLSRAANYYADEKTLYVEKFYKDYKDVESINFDEIKTYFVEKSFSFFSNPLCSVIVCGENKVIKLIGIKKSDKITEILKSKNIEKLSEEK